MMDFHGMNRKNLQILCKKHGIPANLKNTEMANRLASLFLQKEDEADDGGIKEEENVVASRKAKRVRFSPETENQVFEFTRSVKKNVRTTLRRQDKAAKAAPQRDASIELKRSKRSVSKGIESNGDVEAEKGPSNSSKRIGSSGSSVKEEGKEDADLIEADKGIQGGRRSSRLAGKTEAASKPVDLLPAAASAAKGLKRIGSSGGSTQEEGKDIDLNALERVEGKDIQEGRRSRRLAARIEKSFEEGGTSKSVTLVPAAKRSKGLVDVAHKEKESGEQHRKDDDSIVEMVRRRSMRFVNEQNNTQDQRRRSVRLKASVADSSMGEEVSKLKNDEVKAAIVVKGNLADKKTDENLVRSSKRVTRNMKRGRSAESEMDKGTASNQSNLPPKKTLDEFGYLEQEEACGADVKDGGSSKKSKAMNQECIKDKPQGIVIVEDSPSSSKTKAAESRMILEKVVDPTLDKSEDSSQRSNTREMNCERMEGECEEKLEPDTVLMPVMEEDKEEVSSRSLSSPKDKLHVPAGHIIVKDISSTVIAEESTKTKDELLIYAPQSELKEHRSIAKLANVEEILENSTECWNEIHSSKDDEKGSFEKDVQAENLHGNDSECNTENSSAGKEREISKIGVMSVAHCVNLTPEKLLGDYAQLETEEAERHSVEAISSSQKMKKAVGQEFLAEDSPSASETKATEPVVISENVFDSTQKVSGYTSAVRNSRELGSELLEEGRAEKHEQATTKKDNGEVKTCPDNRSAGCSLSVETTLPPALVQLPMRNPEADLGLPTEDDVVSAVITDEDKITKEETLIFTPASELKDHSSVAKLPEVEAECCKEDEKGSLEKDVQAENLHVNFSECNTENSSSEEEMEISKDSCMSVNLTPEKLLDTYTPLVPGETGEPNMEITSSLKKMKTVSSEFLKENPQGIAEDSPSTFVTKTTETIMMSENVSVDISPVGNTQELHAELMDKESDEKQEQDIVLIPPTQKDKEESSSLSEFLTEGPEVSIPEAELFVATTPLPSSVQIAVSNPESELSVPTGHILVKDIVSPVIAEKYSKTEEVPKSVHSFVAKLPDTDAVLETSAECWNESLSSKDDDRDSLGKEKQSAKRHGNFSEYNAENSSAEEQAGICEVGRISDDHCVDRETLDEVKDESLMKSVQTISSERGCKPNALELSGSFSTDFASQSHKEENVSECLEGEEMKALSQPTPINKAASNTLDMSSLFTTPERNLMLMEKLSQSGKIRAADIVTQHNDEAVESHDVVFTTPEQVLLLEKLSESGKIRADDIVTQHNDETVESHDVVFTTPEKVLLLGDSGLEDSGKEEEHTATDFPDESDVLNTSEKEAFNEGERKVVELHDESDIAASPLRQSSVGDFEEEITERNEENRTVELLCESGTCTGPDKHADLANFVSDGAENIGGNKAMEFYEESVAFTGFEESHELFGDSGKDKAREDGVKMDAQFYEEAGLSIEMHKDLPLADPELGEVGRLGIKNADETGRLEGQLLYGDSEQKKAVKPTEMATAEFHDVSALANIPERHLSQEESELEEATKVEENNVLQLQADCDSFPGANITAKSHDISDFLTASESHSLMGDFEPDGEENKDVELLSESNISTDVERHLLSEELGLAETRKIKHSTAATCEESSVFISPERRQPLGNTEPHTAGKLEQKEVQFKDESAFFTRLETRLLLGESDSNVSFSSYVLALAAEGNSETEVAGTCSLVSEESGLPTDIPNQRHDAVEELAIADAKLDTQSDSKTLSVPAEGESETTGKISSLLEERSSPSMDIQNHISDASEEELAVKDNIKADELINAKVTKDVDSSGGSDISGKTCVLAGTEDEHLCYNSEVTDPVDIAFEKDISLTPDESTLQKNMNEEAADNDMLKREATPSPEEILNESSGNIGESGTSSEKQVRRETTLIYRTQAKPKRHNMKENEPNSKIVDNLNVTAPRTSKRQPLQDLKKN